VTRVTSFVSIGPMPTKPAMVTSLPVQRRENRLADVQRGPRLPQVAIDSVGTELCAQAIAGLPPRIDRRRRTDHQTEGG
jgi:hypothetical protein